MDKIVSLAKRRGFIFQTSEIYGGLANAYDYGPLGIELINNIKSLWWKRFIKEREDMVGIDSQIILHPKTWEASGHVGSFVDVVVEDKVTHKQYRADHLIEEWIKNKNEYKNTNTQDMSLEDMADFIKQNKITSPQGNPISDIKRFNLLMHTKLGCLENAKDEVYLRGETAQGIFTNFKNVVDCTRVRLPFGIGQIGKSFRNEITLGQYIFRTFEFEQAEIEYFFNAETDDWEKLLNSWKNAMWKFVVDDLGINEQNLKWRRHTDTERSHYSKDTYDLDYKFPFGWKELWGIAYRSDYDLKQHMSFSNVDLNYFDSKTNKKIIPHVIEPAVGLNRLLLMVLSDAYSMENERVFLKIKPHLAPYTVAVFPLVANKSEILNYAKTIYQSLKTKFYTYMDDRGNIGKRYRYQDEIGTPFCITIDYDTLKEHTVTIRQRDSMEQKRVAVEKISDFITHYINGKTL